MLTMSQVQLSIEPIVFDGPAATNTPGLKLTVKRYTTSTSEEEGLTLLFAHCIASRRLLYREQASLTLM
jgi:hypothetical protein